MLKKRFYRSKLLRMLFLIGLLIFIVTYLARVAPQRLGLFSFFYPGVLTISRLAWNIDLEQSQPEAAIKQLGQRHVMLIHGDRDVTVPVSEAYHLQQAGGANVTATWIVPGVGHAAAYQNNPEEYLKRVLSFFDTELR
ncbi:MAG TPA: prolyl oligopeptidase family serine peptidase [Chloroflexia bacterium]|nr:prolyl oligopeptidase family serine peptidase [Chloroflexia bacterium]